MPKENRKGQATELDAYGDNRTYDVLPRLELIGVIDSIKRELKVYGDL
jgi:hypothetical protein